MVRRHAVIFTLAYTLMLVLAPSEADGSQRWLAASAAVRCAPLDSALNCGDEPAPTRFTFPHQQ